MAYELSYQSIYIILYISIIHMTHKNYFCPLRDMPYNLTNESFLKALKLYYFFPCKMHFKIYMCGFHEGDTIVHALDLYSEMLSITLTSLARFLWFIFWFCVYIFFTVTIQIFIPSCTLCLSRRFSVLNTEPDFSTLRIHSSHLRKNNCLVVKFIFIHACVWYYVA